jgi:Zn-dependent peptidase ImmA (M78 family)
VARPAHVREAVAAARTARHELGLGLDQPVHDLLAVVEETAGLPVGVLALPDGVAGVYIERRERAFVFINADQALARQRFTLAHGGHHRLGHGAVVDGVDAVEGRSSDPREQQANAFAGELLAPEQALRGWMEARGDPLLTVEVLVRIAAWFAISAPAAYVRLIEAGVLQRASQKRDLKRILDRGQHKGVKESLGVPSVEDQLAQIQRENALPRLPALLRDNALAAYAAGLIDLDRFAQIVGRDRDTVERAMSAMGIVPAEAEPDW